MRETIASVYRWHRERGFSRWRALKRAVWCWL